MTSVSRFFAKPFVVCSLSGLSNQACQHLKNLVNLLKKVCIVKFIKSINKSMCRPKSKTVFLSYVVLKKVNQCDDLLCQQNNVSNELCQINCVKQNRVNFYL